MPARLRALYADLELPLSDRPTVLGRSRQLHIASTAISRHACSCFQDGKAQAKLVAHKLLYVKRQKAKPIVQISKDESCKVQLLHQTLVPDQEAVLTKL